MASGVTQSRCVVILLLYSCYTPPPLIAATAACLRASVGWAYRSNILVDDHPPISATVRSSIPAINILVAAVWRKL